MEATKDLDVGFTQIGTVVEKKVSFATVDGYSPTCFSCGTKGHTVNDCPKLDEAEKENFWADRKAAQEAKRGVAHVVVADTAALNPAHAPALSVASVPGSNTSQEFERFQRYMTLIEATGDLSEPRITNTLWIRTPILRLCQRH